MILLTCPPFFQLPMTQMTLKNHLESENHTPQALQPRVLDRLVANISTLASVYHQAGERGPRQLLDRGLVSSFWVIHVVEILNKQGFRFSADG